MSEHNGQGIIERVEQLATLRTEVATLNKVIATVQIELRRVGDMLEEVRRERHPTSSDLDKLEGRLRFLELAMAGVGLYGGWSTFQAP